VQENQQKQEFILFDVGASVKNETGKLFTKAEKSEGAIAKKLDTATQSSDKSST
jgi:hypothetical protein